MKNLKKAVLACILSGLALTHAVAEPVKIRVGWVVAPANLAPILFAKPGIAKHLGKSYVIEPLYFAGTPAQITALATGEVDIAEQAYSSFATAVQQAQMTDLRVVLGEYQDGRKGQTPGDLAPSYVVLKDSPIKTVDDLKGKILATNAPGSSVDIPLRAMLKNKNISDSNVISVPFPNMKSMLLEGKIDLGIRALPFAADPEFLSKTRALFTQTDAMGGPTMMSFWAAKKGFIDKNRAALVDFFEDTLAATRWYTDPKNHDEAVAIVAKFTKLKPEIFNSWLFTQSDYYRYVNGDFDVDALNANIASQHKAGFLDKPLDVTPYVDLSMVKEAAQRLNK